MRHHNKKASDRITAGVALNRGFWADERAQDITEYTLLLAFVVLASAAVLTTDVNSMGGIWSDARGILSSANVQAASS